MPQLKRKKLSLFIKDKLASILPNGRFRGLTSSKNPTIEYSKAIELAQSAGGKINAANEAGFFVSNSAEAPPNTDWLDKHSGEDRRNWSKVKVFAVIVLVFSLASAGAIYYFLVPHSSSSVGEIAGVFEENADANIPANMQKHVLGEKITASGTDSGVEGGDQMGSESYIVKQMHFGGDLAIVSDEALIGSLEIYDVKSEVLVARNRGKEENKLVITWKTNKLSVSSVEYWQNGSSLKKQLKEENYGFTHNVIISGITQGAAYNYAITARDRWGNEQSPGHYAVYSGSRQISVFELIAKTLGEIFGWAGGSK